MIKSFFCFVLKDASDTEDCEDEITDIAHASNTVTPEKDEKKRKMTYGKNVINQPNTKKLNCGDDEFDVVKDEAIDDVIDSDDINDDSDNSFTIDVCEFKKEQKDSKPKNTTMLVKATEKFYDKNGKECIFLVLKMHYWALKTNIIEIAITTLFKRALKATSDVKELFGGCWSVEEREEPYSTHSEAKVAKGTFPQYVLLMKVIVEKYTVMTAVDIITETIRRFMKSKSFPECYKLSFPEEQKKKLYELVCNPEHALYKVCRQMDIQKSYSDTLDCLVHDEAIYKVFMLETNKTKRELLACGMCAKIMFKNPTVKQN